MESQNEVLAKYMAFWGTVISLTVLLFAVSMPGIILLLSSNSAIVQSIISIKVLMFWFTSCLLPFFLGLILIGLSPFVALISDTRHLSRVQNYPWQVFYNLIRGFFSFYFPDFTVFNYHFTPITTFITTSVHYPTYPFG